MLESFEINPNDEKELKANHISNQRNEGKVEKIVQLWYLLSFCNGFTSVTSLGSNSLH